MRERESGYYWVKLRGEWVVAEYRIYYWFHQNLGNGSTDAVMEEIDERKIVRDEPKQWYVVTPNEDGTLTKEPYNEILHGNLITIPPQAHTDITPI